MRTEHRARLGALWVPAVLAACAATPAAPEKSAPAPIEPSVQRIIARLVGTAELRMDLASVRVWLMPLEEPARGVTPALAQPYAVHALVGRELEQELVLALSQALYVLDPELVGETQSEDEVVRDFGATHFVMGSYAPQDDNLILSLRLVDARTKLIVAAARGIVDVASLSEPSRLALAPAPVQPNSAQSALASTPGWLGSSAARLSQSPGPQAPSGSQLYPHPEPAPGRAASTFTPSVARDTPLAATQPEPIETQPVELAGEDERVAWNARRALYTPKKDAAPAKGPSEPGPAALRLRAIGREFP
jgi:hypothetical protein